MTSSILQFLFVLVLFHLPETACKKAAPMAEDNEVIVNSSEVIVAPTSENQMIENEDVVQDVTLGETPKSEPRETVKDEPFYQPATSGVTKKDPIKEPKARGVNQVPKSRGQVSVSEMENVNAPITVEEKKIEKEVDSYDAFREMHGEWAKLLKQYVSASGEVDYRGFVSDRSHLEGYLAVLANNPPEASWSRDQKLAYWINAYNAFTIQLIVKNYPLESITDLYNGKPWDEKWIRIAGSSYSLNQIENEIIRPRFNEPRIHFAVNCAAVSCPPLSNQAFTADNVNALLEKQTKAFIQNSSLNSITPSQLTLSKIFDWYQEDFGDVVSFVSKYSKVVIKKDAQIDFKEYVWALNGK